MRKAVFLDRDGVINDGSLYYTYRIEDFIINPDIPEALKLLCDCGYALIVVSNQSGVAKGVYSENDVEMVHEYMKTVLEKQNIKFDGIYYCPHHPDVADCECRKPKNKLFLDAISEHNIDPDKSFMIGDSKRDIEAAHRTGIKAFKIEKNQSILSICKLICNGGEEQISSYVAK